MSNGSRITLVKVGVVALLAVALAGCQNDVGSIASPQRSALYRAATVNARITEDPIDGQYIVVLKSGSNVDVRAQKLIEKTSGKLNRTYRKGLKGFAARMSSDDAAALRLELDVAYVERDQRISVGGNPRTAAGLQPTTQKRVIWNLDRIDQSDLPLTGTYTYTETGVGTNVYVIDTGIRTTHAEFGGRATADFSVIDDGYGATGCHWHGTHVAATITGTSVGVAKGAYVHSVRVMDCNGSGSVSGLIAGIDWVVANAKLPAVINMSVVGGYSQAENDAIQKAIDAGITVVIAAGNNGGDACGYSPSSAPNAITVAATLQTDSFAPFSNFGACVDVIAPGGSVYSASNETDRAMRWADGTSMASPHVAGVAAQFLQTHPTARPAEVETAILQSATRGIIPGLDSLTANALLRSR